MKEKDVKIYGSETLATLMKHLTVELKEGDEIGFPFHLENFCREMDLKLQDLRGPMSDKKNTILQ